MTPGAGKRNIWLEAPWENAGIVTEVEIKQTSIRIDIALRVCLNINLKEHGDLKRTMKPIVVYSRYLQVHW